jgi:hypothetical protein
LLASFMNKKARGILPDAVNAADVILIKSCPSLRPTYEVRLATYMAQQTHRRLRLILTTGASAHPFLIEYARQHGVSIEHHT